MMTIELLRRALDDAAGLVTRIRHEDLARPTPCAGWDLNALLAHMVGQNHGFADAADTAPDEVPVGAFAPRPVGPEPGATWRASADRMATSLAGAPGDVGVHLPEIAPDRRLPLDLVAGIQVIDTVVHTWDVATAVGRRYRPDDDLLDVVRARVEHIPDGPERSVPGAAFAPAVASPDPVDPWSHTLTLLGRTPG